MRLQFPGRDRVKGNSDQTQRWKRQQTSHSGTHATFGEMLYLAAGDAIRPLLTLLSWGSNDCPLARGA